MGKFDLKTMLEKKLNNPRRLIREQVFGSIATITANQLSSRLEKLNFKLWEAVRNNKIDSNTLADLDSVYYDQCVNNKSIPKGGFLGDEKLFRKFLAYYPTFKQNIGLLKEKDLDFIENVSIPFIDSIKAQLLSELFSKGFKE